MDSVNKPPVPETPLDRWLNTYFDYMDPGKHVAGDQLRAIVRTAQREAAERGFRAGWDAYALGSWREPSKAWAASALHAELEDPT